MPDTDLTTKTALELIADGDKDAISKYSSESSASKSQMSIFLVEQAKRELNTIIRYTRILDKLQEKYEKKIIDYLEDEERESEFIRVLPVYIDHISKCIDRSRDIIKTILKDDKLINIFYTDMSQNNTTNNTTNNIVEMNLSDPQSRQKVRSAVSKILGQIGGISSSE